MKNKTLNNTMDQQHQVTFGPRVRNCIQLSKTEMEQHAIEINFNSDLKQNHFEIHDKKLITTVSSSLKNHKGLSTSVRLKNINQHHKNDLESNNYKELLVDIHKNKAFIAYVIKSNKTLKITETGITIVSTKTNKQETIKGFSNEIIDIKFSQQKLVVLASTDGISILVDKILSLGNIQRVYVIDLKHSTTACACAMELQNYRLFWFSSNNNYAKQKSISSTSSLKKEELLACTCGNALAYYNIVNLSSSSSIESIEVDKNQTNHQKYSELLTEHNCRITGVCFQPCAQHFLVADDNGFVNFYKVTPDKLVLVKKIRPHDGEAISFMFLLDKFDNNVFFLITFCKNTSELKLWNCRKWECLQQIQFKNADSSLIDFRIAIDSSGSNIVLLTQNSKQMQFIYIVQIMSNVRKKVVYFKSICEFLIMSDQLLSFSIIESGFRNYKCSNKKDFQLTKNFKNYKQETQTVHCVAVRFLTISSKYLKDCLILYQPSDKVHDVKVSENWLPDNTEKFLGEIHKNSRVFQDTPVAANPVIGKFENFKCLTSTKFNNKLDLCNNSEGDLQHSDYNTSSSRRKDSENYNLSGSSSDSGMKEKCSNVKKRNLSGQNIYRTSDVSHSCKSQIDNNCKNQHFSNEKSAEISQLVELVMCQSQQINQLLQQVAELKENEIRNNKKLLEQEERFQMKMEHFMFHRYPKNVPNFNFVSKKSNCASDCQKIDIFNLEQSISKNIVETIRAEFNTNILPELFQKIENNQESFKVDVIEKFLETYQKLNYRNFTHNCQKIASEILYNSSLMEIQKDLKALALLISTDLIGQHDKSYDKIKKNISKSFSNGSREIFSHFAQYFSKLNPVSKKIDEILKLLQAQHSNCLVVDTITSQLQHPSVFSEQHGNDPPLNKKTASEQNVSIEKKSKSKELVELRDNSSHTNNSSRRIKSDVIILKFRPQQSLDDFIQSKNSINSKIQEGNSNAAFQLAIYRNNNDLIDLALKPVAVAVDDENINVFRICYIEKQMLMQMQEYVFAQMMQKTSFIRQQFLLRLVQSLNSSNKDPLTYQLLRQILKICEDYLATYSDT